MVDEVETVEDTLDDLEKVVQTEEDKQFEAQARRMGWRPKEEYGGNADRWVDARTFVERGQAELPILRERYRKLDDRQAAIESELKETRQRLQESGEVLKELRDLNRTAEDRAFRRAQSELQAREREAVREASEDKYEAIQREREELERSRPKTNVEAPVVVKQPDPPVATNPIIDQWVSDNPWFQTDQVLHVYAISVDAQIKRDNPHLSVAEQLAEVKKEVMEKFPEKFNNRRRTAPPPVAVSTASPVKTKGKTVNDLPADAKKALAKIKSQIPGYKDEEYLKQYFDQE